MTARSPTICKRLDFSLSRHLISHPIDSVTLCYELEEGKYIFSQQEYLVKFQRTVTRVPMTKTNMLRATSRPETMMMTGGPGAQTAIPQPMESSGLKMCLNNSATVSTLQL